MTSYYEPTVATVQAENGTEYTLIYNTDGDGIQHAIIQNVSGDHPDNVDPNTQVVMLQPITITQDGLDPTQITVVGDQGLLTQEVLDGVAQVALPQGQGGVLQHILEVQQEQPQYIVPQQPPPPKPAKPPEIKPPVRKGPHKCEICAKIFPKWNQYQRHIKTHEEEDKPWRCPKCTQTFNVEDNLHLHMAIHDPENPVCPECGKKFSRLASLKAHLMLHEKEENLMCPECGDEFCLQSHLDKHMQEHRDEQEGTKTYPCKQCNVEFNKLTLLREHMKQHYKIRHSLSHRTYKRNIDRTGFSHKCTHCSKTFKKPSQLERHLRIHTGERPFACTQCEKTFNQKGALQIHMSTHTQGKPYTCEFCPATFAQRGNLRAHIQRVHSTPKDPNNPVHQCEECSCCFRKLGSLNAHISRMHSETQEKKYATNQNMDGSNKENVPSVDEVAASQGQSRNVTDVIQQLLELSEQVGDSQAAQLQQLAASENISSDILQQALENSGLPATGQPTDAAKTTKTSISIQDTATGIMKKHTVRKVNGVRWHQCTYCTKEFKKPSDLVRHIRIHTHEKPYKCSQCFRAFAVKSTLTAHLKTHSGIKEFKCHICYKMFATQGSLKVHIRLHTGTKPFDCPHCDRRFRTSGHRKSHIASHFKEDSPRKPRRPARRYSKPDIPLPDIPLQEPILITDTGLIQQAPRNQQIYNQYLGDASSVDRPYKCGYCSRGFKKSSHLKQHVRSHTGEKPYKCVQCLRAFVSSGVLKAHVRTHAGIKAYKCLVCDATFTTNGSLKRHMSTHSEVRPFMCPYCQKTFKTSVNCKKHMRTHRHELAMQALQQQQNSVVTDQATEVTISQDDVPEVAEEEETTDLQEEPIHVEVHQVDLSQQLQQAQLASDQQATITLQQQDFTQQDITQTVQTSVIQDALVNDAQLQSTLNPQQVFGQTTFSQSALNPGTQQVINQINQGQYTIQTQPQVQNQVDVSTLANFSQAVAQPITTNLTSTSMQNILQTNEPEVPQVHIQKERPNVIQPEGDDGKRSFRCGYCDKAFKKSSHLKQHVRSHTGERPFKCSQCERQFISSGVLKTHLKTHTGTKDHKCQICQASFTTNGSLTRHMTIHSSVKPFKCPYCNETFRTAFHCKKHMRLHRFQEEGGDGKIKRSRMSVMQLSEEQAEILSKKQPDENMSLSERLLIESAAEKDRISEPKDVLLQRMVEQAENVQVQEQEPMQDDEQRVTVSQNEDGTVVVNVHEENETADEDLGIDETEKELTPPAPVHTFPTFAHACQHCPKSFKKPSDLVRHIRIHTGEKPFACELCGRAFTVRSTLDSHMKTHAATEKNFQCHVCNASFSTKGSLKVHMRLHTGAKPFKCPHCDHKFRTSGHRKSHIASHFRTITPKKRRSGTRSGDTSLIGDIQQQIGNDQLVTNQVISVDQNSLGQGQNVMPLSLSVDATGNITDSGLTAQVLQGLDGIQLQLGQGIQITGLDPSLMNQTFQIDASVLQQLQGNVNLTFNPNIMTQNIPTADPNLVQNIQIQQVAPSDAVNPNIIIQQGALQQGQPANATDLQQVAVQAGIDASSVVASTNDQHIVTLQQPQQQQVQHAGLQQVTLQAPQLVQTTDGLTMHQATSIVDTSQMGQVTQEMVVEGSPAGNEMDEPEDDEPMVHEVVGDAITEHLVTDEGIVLQSAADASVLDEQQDESMTGEESLIQRHVVTVNPGDTDRTHVCPICNKAFKRIGHLKEHIMTHNPELASPRMRITPHKCTTCEKSFSKPSQLERHMRVHTGERPYVCELCKKAFNQTNALQMHMKKHSGDKPHMCPYCTNAFTQKGNLKTHIKRAHHVEMVQSMHLPKGSVTADSTALMQATSILSDGNAKEEGIDLENVADLFGTP